jgi:hypothetical protein
MYTPRLGIVRGKYIRFQRKILMSLANTNGIEMKIITYNQHGTDDLIFYVIDSHCQSVYFISVANISKTFLFSLRFIYEVQRSGISVFVANDLAQPTSFFELNKEQYQQQWEMYLDEWVRLEEMGANWWKPYYRLDNKGD